MIKTYDDYIFMLLEWLNDIASQKENVMRYLMSFYHSITKKETKILVQSIYGLNHDIDNICELLETSFDVNIRFKDENKISKMIKSIIENILNMRYCYKSALWFADYYKKPYFEKYDFKREKETLRRLYNFRYLVEKYNIKYKMIDIRKGCKKAIVKYYRDIAYIDKLLSSKGD